MGGMRQERFTAHWESFDSGLEQALCWRGKDYASLLPQPLDGKDRDVCPAFVFALAGGCGFKGRDVVELALALEYTYLSFRVHRFIRDMELAEQARQYGVLFGDFFAAQVLASLSGDLLYPHTAKFTETMRTMNEGALLRGRLRENADTAAWREVLRREKAALLLPVRVFAEWASLAQEETQLLERLAAELGVLWGAGEEGRGDLLPGGLTAAETLISETRPAWRDGLRGFFLDLTSEVGAGV
ncbi:MAG: hypothetical protein LBK56_10655 [Gracilibacteraceae bacterium]|jgi:hypothetical protein|nr:hypothetical protein [Gracilibacteraceae bacterium]